MICIKLKRGEDDMYCIVILCMYYELPQCKRIPTLIQLSM